MKVDLPATIFDEAKALSFRAGGGGNQTSH